MSETAISVCFCIDENYVCQLGAVLGSLVESNALNNIDIYVLSNGVSVESKERLQDVVRNVLSFTITFVDTRDADIAKLEAGGHISSATYIRFEIPSLLSHLDKVIYLDADLVIMDDLCELWNTDVSNVYVGAVTNPFFDRYGALSMDAAMGYFNAGVLLMNLFKWRSDSVKDKAVRFLNENKEACIMFDQDALNSVFKGHWKEVNVKWNLQTVYLRYRKSIPREIDGVDEAIRQPGIIHYSSSSKPWDFLDPHPMRYAYLKHADHFGHAEIELSLAERLRRMLRWLYLKFVFGIQMPS